MHGERNHTDIIFHFIRDLFKDEVIELVSCNTQIHSL